MPIYRYQCVACDTEFNALELAGHPATTHCQHCQSGNIQRLPSAPGVQFKGKGFYATDRRKRSNVGPEKNETKENVAGDKGSRAENNDGPSAKKDPKPVTSQKKD